MGTPESPVPPSTDDGKMTRRNFLINRVAPVIAAAIATGGTGVVIGNAQGAENAVQAQMTPVLAPRSEALLTVQESSRFLHRSTNRGFVFDKIHHGNLRINPESSQIVDNQGHIIFDGEKSPLPFTVVRPHMAEASADGRVLIVEATVSPKNSAVVPGLAGDRTVIGRALINQSEPVSTLLIRRPDNPDSSGGIIVLPSETHLLLQQAARVAMTDSGTAIHVMGGNSAQVDSVLIRKYTPTTPDKTYAFDEQSYAFMELTDPASTENKQYLTTLSNNQAQESVASRSSFDSEVIAVGPEGKTTAFSVYEDTTWLEGGQVKKEKATNVIIGHTDQPEHTVNNPPFHRITKHDFGGKFAADQRSHIGVIGAFGNTDAYLLEYANGASDSAGLERRAIGLAVQPADGNARPTVHAIDLPTEAMNTQGVTQMTNEGVEVYVSGGPPLRYTGRFRMPYEVIEQVRTSTITAEDASKKWLTLIN